MGFHVFYAGSRDIDYGLMVVCRPKIPAPKKRVTITAVSGRVDDVSYEDGSYEDMTIPVEFNYVTRPEQWTEEFRQAILWLRRSGVLQFSDDLGVFYKVRYIEIAGNERSIKRLGKFTASFVCQPGSYYIDGARFITLGDDGKITNYYSMAQPIYEITGSGLCTLTVNGKTMTADVDQTLTIDTDRLIAYKALGATANTAVTGDYDDLILVPGTNMLSVSDGFTLRVQPNWRVL